MSISRLPSPGRLEQLLQGIGRGLLERDAAVRLALLAALAGEHVLLIGPPGTAKSALARRLHGAFAEVRYFERLLTRFSTPEELFGPLSLKALEDDRYERLVDGFLPTAGIAFLDEVFKANSAILNALLTLLNEREFDNGTRRWRTPLVAVVAASNEVPADEALQAFYDRFLVRVPVAAVGDPNFAALLTLEPDDAGSAAAPIDAVERHAVTAAAARVAVGGRFIAGCRQLRESLAARQGALSDRRWRQLVGLARTAAATEGRAELDAWDLWLAPFVAASRPEEVPVLERWFEDEWLAAPPAAAPWLERAVQAFEKQLELEQSAPTAQGDDSAGKLALARAIGMGRGDDDAQAGMQRIVSARLEERLRRRWSAVHVAARVAQVGEVQAQVAELRCAVAERAAAQRAALTARLWMPRALVQRLVDRDVAALALLDHFSARLQDLRNGFEELPLREDAAIDEVAPAPVVLEAAPS